MTRQFVACQFNPWDRRTYTYHNDGEPLAVGDEVRVDSPRGEQTVKVTSLLGQAPDFPTKPILGRATPPEPQQRSLI